MTESIHLGIGASFGMDSGHGSPHEMLAERLGVPCENRCRPGHGNDFMITDTLLWLAQRRRGVQRVTASVGISDPYRHDMVDEPVATGLHWSKWRASQRYGAMALRRLSREADLGPYKWNIRLTYHLRYLTQILTLQNIFRAHRIPYLMWQVMRPTVGNYSLNERAQARSLEKQIDTQHFFGLDDYTQIDHINETQQWTDPTPLERPQAYGHTRVTVRDEHPTRGCNEQLAEMLWRHHLENNSLTSTG